MAAAKAECPDLITIQGDVSTEASREALVIAAKEVLPDLNVLINNAGIQNRLPSIKLNATEHSSSLWKAHKLELATNLEAPMHLTFLLLPTLLERKAAQVVNVTSGLSFVPIAIMPTYCATKAALHSFTLSLRQQLLDSSVSVLEIIPPAVNTDLGGAGLHTFGEPLDAFADHIIGKMIEGDEEIGYKFSDNMRLIGKEQLSAAFKHMNSLVH